MQSPWQTLSEENILNAVEHTLGLKLNNLCLKRNSYINRVYELEQQDGSKRLIVKFYRPGRWAPELILEEHRFVLALQQAEIPVIVPQIIAGQSLFKHREFHFAVYPKMGGRSLDEFDTPMWRQLGRLFARIHLVGARHLNSQRIAWTPRYATQTHLETIQSHGVLPPDFAEPFVRLVTRFIHTSQKFFENEPLILIHGDAHRANLIHRPNEGLYVLDFDDICRGLPVQDLWMFLPESPEKCEPEITAYREGYEQFREFHPDQLRLIPFLRGMRLIHFAAWCAVQKQESEFAEHFPEWGNARYWRDVMLDLEEILKAF